MLKQLSGRGSGEIPVIQDKIMKKTMIIAAIAASTAVGILAFDLGTTNSPAAAPAVANAASATVAPTPAATPAPAMSRRERLARIVAETAAATAEKTAKSMLHPAPPAQETAER